MTASLYFHGPWRRLGQFTAPFEIAPGAGLSAWPLLGYKNSSPSSAPFPSLPFSLRASHLAPTGLTAAPFHLLCVPSVTYRLLLPQATLALPLS
jgi:hypothetical protein